MNKLFLAFILLLTPFVQSMEINQATTKEFTVVFVDQKNNRLEVNRDLLVGIQDTYLYELINAAENQDGQEIIVSCPIPIEYLRFILLDAKLLKRNMVQIDDMIKNMKNQTSKDYAATIRLTTQLAIYSYNMNLLDLFKLYTTVIGKVLSFDQWRENIGCYLSKQDYNVIAIAAFPLAITKTRGTLKLISTAGSKYSIALDDIDNINSHKLNNFVFNSLTENEDGYKVLPSQIDPFLLKLCIQKAALYKNNKINLEQLIQSFKNIIKSKKQWHFLYKLARDLNLASITSALSCISNDQKEYLSFAQEGQEEQAAEASCQVGSLKKRKRKHTKEKSYICNYPGCTEVFSHPYSLSRHKLSHTGEKPYVCDYPNCGKAFFESYKLTRHERVHTGEMPYTCDYPGCGKAFSESGNLTRHKRVHTGEKPYVCDYPSCDKVFSASSDLTTHKRSHTGERPYVCDYPGCDKAFSASGDLTRHNKTHTGEKSYVCNYPNCNKAYSQACNLTRHKQKKHDNTHSNSSTLSKSKKQKI